MAPKWSIVAARNIKFVGDSGQTTTLSNSIHIFGLAQSVDNVSIICCVENVGKYGKPKHSVENNDRKFSNTVTGFKFKVFLRNCLKKNEYRKNDIKAFLNKLNTKRM
jgi:DNA-directed RNA polymerase alpha subunit